MGHEPENDDKYMQILDMMNRDSESSESFSNIDYGRVWDAFKAGQICDRCTWFFQGGDKSAMVLEKHHIHHANCNPVLRSDWFVDRFMWRGFTAREYDNSYAPCYRLFLEDIPKMHNDIESLEKPIRDSDKEAYEETMDTLSWIESMFTKCKDKNIDVLYFGEV